MFQITKRIMETPTSRRHHIQQLNALGRQIPKMHGAYLEFQKTNIAKHPADNEEIATAVMEILQHMELLATTQLELDIVRYRSEPRRCKGRCPGVTRWLIKMKYGNRMYWVRARFLTLSTCGTH